LNIAGPFSYSVPNSSEFTALFDQYRIATATVKLVYSNNVSTTAAATTFLPLLYVCEDRDDGNPPTSLGELLQRPETRLWQMGTNGNTSNIRTYKVKPTAVTQLYSGGTAFAAYGDMPPKTWIDTNFPSANLYGFKVWWDTDRLASLDMGNLDIIVDLVYEFRGVR